ncbi:hypothetical protein AC578_10269 [Pseudocercospora eumusae]|uniref:Uncharacterized protein n=1 Tax=Pseudocercospora eumusae TaxID=321146 RepID=A0A139HRF7_9PEZI|nr:hypothetical protein AC578_10269 [Pseudocercospora eumusae]
MLQPQNLAAVRRHALTSIATRATTTAIVRSSAAYTQSHSRSFLGWRRPNDYANKNDPSYYRLCKYRTLKTRAKLIDKLRRKGRWDWDVNQRPFFTSKHIRFASHVGRPKWYPRKGDEDAQEKKPEEIHEEDSFELSQREKEWKEQMEAMRKRIEQDPYEAVFGKRFEPFWSPLVPSWMRDDMGLEGFSKPKDAPSASHSTSSSKTDPIEKKQPAEQYKPLDPEPIRRNRSPSPRRDDVPEGQLTNYSYDSQKTVHLPEADGPNGQLTSYSYGSSTSWDSWTKKSRREEWDSVTGQTRRYEYDPISNRMVPIDAPKPIESEVTKLGSELQDHPKTSQSPLMDHSFKANWIEKTKPEGSEASRLRAALKGQPKGSLSPLMAHGFKSVLSEKASEAVDVPVKTSKTSLEDRKAIPVPTQNSEGKKTSVYFPSLLNTSLQTRAAKASAVTRVPENEVDTLTAEDVRASVGKHKSEVEAKKSLQSDVNEIRARQYGKADLASSQWDQAEYRVMLEQQVRSLIRAKEKLLRHGSKAELAAIETKLDTTNQRLDQLDSLQATKPATEPVTKLENVVEAVPVPESSTTLRSALDRLEAKSSGKWTPEELQKLEEMRRSGVPYDQIMSRLGRSPKRSAFEATDLDDSAAHESTGDQSDYKANVPRDWEKAAELLQADRVRRTRGDPVKQAEDDILSMRKSGMRWIDIMNVRKAKYDAEKAEQKAAAEARDAEKNTKLEKANAMLEAEVQEQKFKMQAHENRYAHKIQSLRKELDTAYKQSSTNAEMHVDRIKYLEQELEKAQKAAGEDSHIEKYQSEAERYKKKIAELRKELDIAFKQSSTASEKHVERIRQLEKEVDSAQKNSAWKSKWEKHIYVNENQALRDQRDSTKMSSNIKEEKHLEQIRQLQRELAEARKQNMPAEATQAEGDMSANVTKYAKNNSKWYKQPASMPLDKHLDKELAKYEQKKKSDQDLVREVRDIYEKQYGKIDVNHRQPTPTMPRAQIARKEPQVVEVESDVDLGKALADFEKGQTYHFKRDNLEAEVAAQEKEAHEAQASTAPESSFQMHSTIANELGLDKDVYGSRSIEKDAPKVIASDCSEKTATQNQTSYDIQWAEPPLYKVLAYDSGNDLFSIATTSTNFTGKETPISIPEALSNLYQPARFVSHFAELQKEGFQVIHGTKDLLVFKKVAKIESPVTPASVPLGLEDHGLTKGTESKKSVSVNPIDGTTEPETGSFASPTGFVGDRWDKIISSEGIAQSPSTVSHATSTFSPSKSQTTSTSTESTSTESSDEIRHSPRIKREERVFSGNRLSKHSKPPRHHHHETTREQVYNMKEKWYKYERRFHTAVYTGLCASALAYCIGAQQERNAQEKRKEDWEKIMQRSRGRFD